MVDDLDDALDDEQREHAYAQRAHNSASSPPLPRDGLVPRYFKGLDCPDKYTCDVIYVDKTTGREVMRYDGADPANTNPYYGATTDADYFARKGLDLSEMVEPSHVTFTPQQLSAMCAVHEDDWQDDDSGWDDLDW